MFIGKNTIFLDKIDSTQIFATELTAKTSPIEGTCVRTDYQTAGKGQIGRYWHSAPKKNLLCSYILYPTFLNIEQSFYLNVMSSLAIFDLCHELSINAKVKWPNDIYVNNKKLAGVLVQNTLQGQNIKSTIVGIGLNINETNFPESLPNPTSIAQLLGQSCDIETLFLSLSQHLENRYLMLKNKKLDLLWADYHSSLYLLNQPSNFLTQEGKTFIGTIFGIEPNGKLRVEVNNNIESFNFREIQFMQN